MGNLAKRFGLESIFYHEEKELDGFCRRYKLLEINMLLKIRASGKGTNFRLVLQEEWAFACSHNMEPYVLPSCPHRAAKAW
jgi:hypothetical protein